MNIETNVPLESLLNLILNYALSTIGAQAGSLMTVNHKRGILQIRSRLGIPKKGRIGEPEYELNGNSVASQAVREKKLIIKNNLSEESKTDYVPSRSENTIQSILSVPIIFGDEVIAVINADSEEKNFFNKSVTSQLILLANEIAPLIAKRISFLEALKEVSFELSKYSSGGDVDEVLKKIADVAVKSLGVDIVTLYEYDQEKDEFIIERGGPKIGGNLIDESKMRTKVEREDVPYKVLEMRNAPLYCKNVKEIPYISEPIKRSDGRLRFIDRENIISMAALLLPNRAYNNPNEEIVGVLFANYKKEHDFNVDEQDALSTFADYAATAILNSRKEKQRREKEKAFERAKKAEQLKSVLDTIVNAAVMDKFDQKTVLDTILKTTMEILQAEACAIYFEDIENHPGFFRCIAGSGFAENIVGIAEYELGEGLTGTIAKEGKEIIIRTKEDLKEYKTKGKWSGRFDSQIWGDKGEFKNLIGVPIRLKNKIIGVIKAENKKSPENLPFSDDDIESLKIIGSVIGLTLENVRLQNKIETQLKSISAKAAHRINNQASNYDGIEYELGIELSQDVFNKDVLILIKNRLKKTTENLKSMINEFKQFGKPLNINRTLCNLNKIISDEVWIAQQNIESNIIMIDKELDNELPDINIDEGRFAEAIKELIRNSIKSISKTQKKNGRILIKTIYDKKNRGIVFKIEDNGAGFPKDLIVFEPFNTTDTQSTGLGLYTVKELIERHEGSIQKFDIQKGAVIEFRLNLQKNQ
jgi:signal transduction protein with GAF and PtsI domain